jgi:hypothetical protein
MDDKQLWSIFDERTDVRVTGAAFLSEESAGLMIKAWKIRQAKGGRPDVDATHLVVRPLSLSDLRRGSSRGTAGRS